MCCARLRPIYAASRAHMRPKFEEGSLSAKSGICATSVSPGYIPSSNAGEGKGGIWNTIHRASVSPPRLRVLVES